MKKFNCIFCKFEVKKDYNLIKHYKKKHDVDFNFENLMNINDFIKLFKDFNRKDAQIMHVKILKKLHSKINCLKLGYGSGNINHDFHEIIFHLIYDILINKNYQKNNNYMIIINSKMSPWTSYIIICILEYFKIKYNFDKNLNIGYQQSLNYNVKSRKILRYLFFYPDYLYVLEKIRNIIFEKNELKNSKKLKVLYTRKDMLSRRLIGFEKIYKYFDLVIDNLSNLSIEGQVKLFFNTSFFVCPNGACTANIIFMNRDTNVLDIQTHNNNSWQIKYGTSKLIKNYKLIYAKNLKLSLDVNNSLSEFRKSKQDYDILLDDKLEKNIVNFLG